MSPAPPQSAPAQPCPQMQHLAPVKGVDYYEKLGVRPFINAAGTYTVLSASIMPDEVQAAVALASRSAGKFE